jgi:hypothetical protein
LENPANPANAQPPQTPERTRLYKTGIKLQVEVELQAEVGAPVALHTRTHISQITIHTEGTTVEVISILEEVIIAVEAAEVSRTKSAN